MADDTFGGNICIGKDVTGVCCRRPDKPRFWLLEYKPRFWLLEYGVEIDAVLIRIKIIGEDLAAEAPHDFAEHFTDFPRSDHTSSLSKKVESKKPFQQKISFPDPVVRAVDLPVQGQDQSDSVFGDTMRRIFRNTSDQDVG